MRSKAGFLIGVLVSVLLTTVVSPASATLMKASQQTVSSKTGVNPLGGDSTQSYPCSVLQYFANFQIERVDLAEVAFWLDFVIDGDPVTTDDALLARLREVRDIPKGSYPAQIKSADSRRTLIEIADEACGPCSIESQSATFNFDKCWLAELSSPTTTIDAGLTQPTAPNSAPPSSTGDPGTSNGSTEGDQSLAQAKAALQQQLSGQIGTLEPAVLRACSEIYAVVPQREYVDIYNFSAGSWGLYKSNPLSGEVISIEQTNVLSDSSLDFWVRFRNGFNKQIMEALLIELNSCNWTFAQFQITGSGFSIMALDSLSFDGVNIVGSNEFRSNIKFLYDKALRLFKEQP